MTPSQGNVPSLSDFEFKLFEKFISDRTGIIISRDKAYLIETRLSRFLSEFGVLSFNELYYKLAKSGDTELSERVIDAITTNETLWFRDEYPWRVLENILMPSFIEKLRNREVKKIRIWSAAASTGQEAYSTAMCISEYLEKNGITDISADSFEIFSTDISKTVLSIAERGRYDSISIMRGMLPGYKEKYFDQTGNVYVLKDKIKQMVNFRHFNLKNSYFTLGQFDLVFTRYVLLYFSDALKQDIVNRMYDTMKDNAVLFIGTTEIDDVLKEKFQRETYGNNLYYKKVGGAL